MKKLFITPLLIALLTAISIGQVLAQRLPRQARLGAYLQAITESNYESYGLEKAEGVIIQQTAGYGTSQDLGLLANDVLLSMNDTELKDFQSTVKLLENYKEGDNVTFEIIRDKKKKTLKGKFSGMPRETDPHAEVIYDHAKYKEGKLNIVINKPKKEGKMPAVLFIPGYTCTPVEGLPDFHPYARIVHAFSEAGYVVLRIEKPGMGDSQNTPKCEDCTLDEEVEAFEQGLLKLKSLPYVDADNIFIFGHSMGGVIAPQLASKHKTKGLMVYGTTAKNWLEYHLEMNRFQGKLQAGSDPVALEKFCREQTKIVYEYFVEGAKMADMAKDPQKLTLMQQMWGYDGSEKIYGRNAEFWRKLQKVNLWEYWKKSNAKVLVLCGGADFQAFSRRDHEDIAKAVNHYRPNTATYKLFPESDHYFAKSGTYQKAFDMFSQQKYMELFNMFNTEITKTAVDWANEQQTL